MDPAMARRYLGLGRLPSELKKERRFRGLAQISAQEEIPCAARIHHVIPFETSKRAVSANYENLHARL
jgi:hypothetical protein